VEKYHNSLVGEGESIYLPHLYNLIKSGLKDKGADYLKIISLTYSS